MQEESWAFADAATRDMEVSVEAREEARAEILGRLEHRRGFGPKPDLVAAKRKLEATKRMPAPLRRGLLLGALLAAIGIWAWAMWVTGAGTVQAVMAGQLSFQAAFAGQTPGYSWLDGRIRSQAPGLPFVVPTAEKLETLHERRPDDLAIFQEMLSWRDTDRETLMSDEERALIEELDPDNAIWGFIEAEWCWQKGGVDTVFSRRSPGSGDPDAWETGWKVFSKAVAKPELVNHALELRRRMIDALPPESGFVDQMTTNGVVSIIGGPGRQGWSYAYFLDQAFEQRLSEMSKLASSGDVSGIVDLAGDFEAFMNLRLSTPEAVVWGGTDYVEQQIGTVRALSSELGAIPGEEATATRMDGLLERLRKITGASGGTYPASKPVRLQGFQASKGLSSQELKPAERVEHAFFSRILALLAVIPLLLFAGAIGFEACRRTRGVKAMARGLGGLFTWRDHLWLGGLGLLAPLLYGGVIIGFSPYGTKDMSFDDEWEALAWVIQCSLWCVLVMVMLVHVAQWRWNRAGGFLGITPPAWWLGRIAAGLLVFAIPVVGSPLVVDSSLSENEKVATLLGLSGAGMIGLLWLLWVAVMNLFTGRHGALGPNLLCRSLLPWSLAALFAALGIAGGLRLSEKHWHQRDPLLKTSDSGPFLNPLEERTCRSIAEAWNE